MVFHWSLSDCESPQVSRTPLSILTYLNSVLAWMVSNSLSLFSRPLRTVPRAPITISTTFTIIITIIADNFNIVVIWTVFLLLLIPNSFIFALRSAKMKKKIHFLRLVKSFIFSSTPGSCLRDLVICLYLKFLETLLLSLLLLSLLLLLVFFSHQCPLVVFHWSLSGSKSPQVSRTLLSILTDLNNAVV